MGEVVEVGTDNHKLRSATASSSRSRSPAAAASSASSELWSLCDNSNPNAWMAEKLYGYSRVGPVRLLAHDAAATPAARREYVRVPFADVGPIKVPDDLTDEQVLFLSDIFPTGYMAAENCNIQPGDTVAVWGCGPVGQFAIKSAWLLGAGRVIAIDREPERLRMAARQRQGRDDQLRRDGRLRCAEGMTGGRGPDACIDAVGLEAHGATHRRVVRQGQDGGVHGDRPADGAAPGDQGLPQGRHGVDPRRLRRVPRQGPVRRGVRQGPDLQDGADPRARYLPTAAGPHRARRDRPVVRDHPPHADWTTRRGYKTVQATSRTTASRSC